MMPARIASTPAEEQIKEFVGSGPFKFAREEWQPGEQIAYVRNSEYVPRDDTPSGSTGGKKVYLDKVVWRYIPDPWDAADDLAAGKVDWWEQPQSGLAMSAVGQAFSRVEHASKAGRTM